MKDEENEIPIEKPTRLSLSKLWELQNAAYTQFGPKAWSSKGVPSYVTSNPYIARAYAHVVLGYFRDCLIPEARTPIDPSEPVYIFDLGAGTGRFGYLFVKMLHQIISALRKEIHFCYVMTDIAQANIDFWKAHPYLNEYIRQGFLDFALYKHDDDKPLQLLISKKEITSQFLKNPIVVIGNYFFDTIPQDLFKSERGQLLEGRIALSVKENEETERLSPKDPNMINHLISRFDYVPIKDLEHYYPNRPDLIKILKHYANTFENIPFMFPEGAFKVINYFSLLSKERMLLLAGDQGRVTEKQLKEVSSVFLALHGSFSIAVNYHAIAMYMRNKGGASFLTTFSDPGLVVTASVLGGSSTSYLETKLAFQTHIDFFEPNDYYLLVNYSEKEWQYPNLDYILLLIKLGNWDPMNFNLFYERIRSELMTASDKTKNNFLDTIQKTWQNFYPTDPHESNFVMNLGVLLYDMKKYDEAIFYFEKALLIDPKNGTVYYNLACCYYNKGDIDKFNEFNEKSKDLKKNP